MVRTLEKIYNCYSAGPGLFPRDLPEEGRRETWDESEARVRALNETIAKIPEFKVITPTNTDLAAWPEEKQARVCLRKDLYLASHCDITFADVTPFGGREPDAGTLVEAVTCALAGGLLVLWADPLTTFEEKYADADVHPDSFLDKHYNLMIEQLFYWCWEVHFGMSRPVFGNLKEATEETARLIREHGLKRIPLLDKVNDESDAADMVAMVKTLITPPASNQGTAGNQ